MSAVVAAGLYYFLSPQADGWLATLWGDQQSGMMTGFSAAALALGLMLIVELPCVPFAARALGGNGWTVRGAIWIGAQVVVLAGIIWWFIPAG